MAKSTKVMDSDSQVKDTAVGPLYRCRLCGIESREPTCFVGIAKDGAQRRAVDCITCHTNARGQLRPARAFGLGVLICLPVFFVSTRRSPIDQTVLLLLAGLAMWPTMIFLHELGHFLTAKLLGLKAILITIGVGKTIWRGRFLGIPLRLHALPLSGLTYLGSDSLCWLRSRLWLTTLMGPASHLALIALALALSQADPRRLPPDYVAIWVMYNALFFLFNILPYRTRSVDSQQTDGLRLLLLPRAKVVDLQIYLSSAALVTGLEFCKEADYAGAQAVCLEGLRHQPRSEWLLLLLSACQTNLGDYRAARETLQKAGDLSQIESSLLRAALMNNYAINEWLLERAAAVQSGTTAKRIDRVSEQAFLMFPCVLGCRSTRALILAGTERAQEALQLLEYRNYQHGSDVDRAEREVTRAFALRELGDHAASARATQAALKISKSVVPNLITLGLVPATARTTIASPGNQAPIAN